MDVMLNSCLLPSDIRAPVFFCTLRGDDAAILGMPFRMLVGLVTLAIITPAVFGGWSTADYIQTEREVQVEISRVLTAAQRHLQAGSGGEVIEVSLKGGTFTRVDYVIFGDEHDQSYSRAVRYKLSGGQETALTARNPSVPLGSPDGGELRLVEGAYRLSVECADGATVTVWPV